MHFFQKNNLATLVYCAKAPIFASAIEKQSSLQIAFGEIPKWPTGADCNSADFVFVGSNPALPTLV